MSLPYMPMYWGDYWRDTGHLSDSEHVAYLRLISHYWQHGSLPNDDTRLARIAGRSAAEWSAMRDTLSEFFKEGWTHPRIDRDRADAVLKRAVYADRAKKAAGARWNASSMLQASYEQSFEECLTNANHNQNHNHNQNQKETELIYRRKQQRGTRLPEDWKPKEHLDRMDEFDAFRDYWIAVPGQRGVKLDWDATWRNWIRRSSPAKPGKPKERDLRNIPDNLLSNDDYWKKRKQMEEWK
jgi:uncharacterized protein YdaU (DUF1376 family)